MKNDGDHEAKQNTGQQMLAPGDRRIR